MQNEPLVYTCTWNFYEKYIPQVGAKSKLHLYLFCSQQMPEKVAPKLTNIKNYQFWSPLLYFLFNIYGFFIGRKYFFPATSRIVQVSGLCRVHLGNQEGWHGQENMFFLSVVVFLSLLSELFARDIVFLGFLLFLSERSLSFSLKSQF